MKLDQEIRNDIYAVLKSSALVAEVSGVLRKTKRPLNSNREDVLVCAPISNDIVGDTQVAYVYVRIYVPDQERDGQMEEDTQRTTTLGTKAKQCLTCYNGGDFRFEWRSQETFEIEEISTHVIAIRLRYEHSI